MFYFINFNSTDPDLQKRADPRIPGSTGQNINQKLSISTFSSRTPSVNCSEKRDYKKFLIFEWVKEKYFGNTFVPKNNESQRSVHELYSDPHQNEMDPKQLQCNLSLTI